MVERPRSKRIAVARPSVDHLEASGRDDNVKMNDPASTSSVSRMDDRPRAFREIDQGVEEDRRKIDAAISICRGC